MANAPRSLAEAATAVGKHIDAGRAINVDQAAAKAVEQRKTDPPNTDPGSDVPTPQPY